MELNSAHEGSETDSEEAGAITVPNIKQNSYIVAVILSGCTFSFVH